MTRRALLLALLNRDPFPADLLRHHLAQLPSFLCRQDSTRFQGTPDHLWTAIETLSAEVSVINGAERYTRLSHSSNPSDLLSFGELATQGEFFSALRVLLDPNSRAAFHEVSGRGKLRRFRFEVPRESSQWYLGPRPGFPVSYNGLLTLDRQSAAVVELSMAAQRLPLKQEFLDAVLRLYYAPQSIAGRSYPLPAKAIIRCCTRRAYCERRVILFSSCRLFSASSTLLPAPAEHESQTGTPSRPPI